MFVKSKGFLFAPILTGMSLVLVSAFAVQAKTVLRVATWNSGEGYKIIRNACNAFTKNNPDIEIKLETWGDYREKMLVSLSAGSAPDVFMLGEVDMGSFLYTGFLQPLTAYIKRDKMNLSGLIKSLQKQYIMGGDVYGLPKDYAPFGVWYNKSLLDAAGISAPTNSWTWQDLILMGKKLTKFDVAGKMSQTGFNTKPSDSSSHFFLSTMGANFMNPAKEEFKGYLDSEATLDAMALLVGMKNREHISPNSWADFGSGKVALSLDGPWNMAAFSTKRTLRYGIALPPKGKQEGGCILSAAWCMSAASKRKNEAWKLVKFLGGPEGNTIMGSDKWAIPAWKESIQELKADSDPNIAQFITASENAVTIAPIQHPFYNKVVSKYIYPILESAWAGKIDVIPSLVASVSKCDAEYSSILKKSPKIVRKQK